MNITTREDIGKSICSIFMNGYVSMFGNSFTVFVLEWNITTVNLVYKGQSVQ